MPISQAARLQIEKRIAVRRADRSFQKRLRKRLEEDRMALDRL